MCAGQRYAARFRTLAPAVPAFTQSPNVIRSRALVVGLPDVIPLRPGMSVQDR
jgi:hypothetical protein